MLFRLPAEVLILLIPVLLFSLCFHEFSHAYSAYKLGDKTAYRMGRLTLHPLAHIDPMGAIMILFVGFGWAKPVPVNPYNLRNPRTDMMIIAGAGPASNLVLAFIGGMCIRLIPFLGGYLNFITGDTILQLLYFFTYINTALAIFNLIPIPPLDGSQIFSGILIKNNPDFVQKLQFYGPRVLFGILILGYITGVHLISMIMSPFISVFMFLFAGIG